jgi:hypothetical protein
MTETLRSTAECINTFMAGRHGLGAPSIDERVEARTIDIANRLRFVCGHLPDDELLDLAMRMAIVEVKYSAGGVQLHAPRRRVAGG